MASYIKQIIGAAIGVAAALLILFLGFWKGVLVVALGLAGWWLAGERKMPQWAARMTEKFRNPDQEL